MKLREISVRVHTPWAGSGYFFFLKINPHLNATVVAFYSNEFLEGLFL
jgi:hypothetical protein